MMKEREGGFLATRCECQDASHIMVFNLEEFKDEPPELYVSVQLNPQSSWWRRLGIAFGYILGKRSRFTYGHWDAGSISSESARGLILLLGEYLSLVRSDGTTTVGTTGVRG